MNAWISPRGDVEQVGYFGHANFAIDQQKEDDMLLFVDGHQAVQELHDTGWGRVVDWDIGKIQFMPPSNGRWSNKQIEAILFLAEQTNTRIEWDGNSYITWVAND